VTKRLRDDDGNPIGRASNKLITDTRVFEVEYADGHTVTMSANAITQCMFEQVDQGGNRLLLLDEVVDHRSTKDAITHADAFINASNGRRRRRQTTKGWELRLVADGHKTDAPASTITYSSVVSRDSVRIALTIAALNDLDVSHVTFRTRS
jgi:hypothetical protein